MSERIDAWYVSVLPKVGALSDEWLNGWVYLAVTKCEGRVERGFLFDVSPDHATTRETAIEAGRRELQIPEPATIVEEWAYTTEETKQLDFRTFVGGNRPGTVESGCGCGEEEE